MSPSRSGLVGSPTRQASNRWPCSAAQASSFTVPLTDSRSSSPVISRLTEPCAGQPSATRRAAAATNAATPLFMSAAPRPYSRPSSTAPANGSSRQPSRAPGGTTSTWPAEGEMPAALRPAWRRDCRPGRCRHCPRSAAGGRSKPERLAGGLEHVQGAARVRRDASGSGPAPGVSATGSAGVHQSRSSSLIEVLARVPASTRLTITAQ